MIVNVCSVNARFSCSCIIAGFLVLRGWLVKVAPPAWNMDAIKKNSRGVKFKALPNKADAIQKNSPWGELMVYMRTKPRHQPTMRSEQTIPWPEDPLDCNLQSMTRWATSPIRLNHCLLSELGGGTCCTMCNGPIDGVLLCQT